MAAWAVAPVSNPLRVPAQALASRAARVLAAATRRTNAPEPGEVSLSVVWGVATFAIIIVLALAQVPQVRDAFLATLPGSATAIVAELGGPSAVPTGSVGRPLGALDGRGTDAAGVDTGAQGSLRTGGAQENADAPVVVASAPNVSPADGSPEPARSVTTTEATAPPPQPSAAPTSAPVAAAPATTVLGPLEVVASPVPVASVLAPVASAVTTTVTTVTTAVAPSVAPAPAPVIAPTATAKANQKGPSGGTPAKAK